MGGVPTDPDAARAALAASPGEPVWLDVAVIATRVAERSGPSKLGLRLEAEDGTNLGSAYVFTQEWYPGARGQRFSHYFLALQRCFEGLERSGRETSVRLQLLCAVRARGRGGREMTVLLKFIIAPEYAISGAMLERIYGCPLAHFYEGFVGIDRDPLRDRTEPAFTRGNAVHAGYRRAADAFLETGDAAAARAAYFDGVRRSWVADFPHLLLDRPKTGPKKLHTAPVLAADPIVSLCEEQWGDGATAELLQERLLFAPSRGVSGRADRIERRGAVIRLTEVKTGGSFGSERDPVTGARHAGGVQALAYRELLRARSNNGLASDTVIEDLDGDSSVRVALERHPVVTRAGATLEPNDERALDLLAQSRNVGYIVATGLLTGYDRHLLDGASRAGRFLRGAGGDFSLYSSAAPCQMCVVNSRSVCEQTRRPMAAPLYNLFRYAPPELFAYWAWFHRQVQQEERAGREWLYHLATTPVTTLEQQEGVSLSGLRVREQLGPVVVFARETALETRIREDDRVLLTPDGLRPGDARSVEGSVEHLGTHEVTVRLRDRLADPRLRYRLDDIGRHDMASWQVQGLTDFLVASMDATTARGRAIKVEELPPLAQTFLWVGREPANVPVDPPVPVGVRDLNASQRKAVGAALGLDPAAGEVLLIQGPPGTGKTTMIAELARAIVAAEFCRDELGASERPLLILANSHRAVDEVILKLATRYPDLKPYLVRVGSPRTGMEPAVRECVLTERLGVEAALAECDLEAEGPSRLVALVREGNVLHDQAVIFAGTLAGSKRPELRGLSFRTVIVDESGQATEPAALQALRHLPPGYQGRLALVGDQQQLPPVVADQSDISHKQHTEIPVELEHPGICPTDTLRTSLFERLARRYPQRLITLSEQYRMASPICALVSNTFYDGQLRPGTSEVAERWIGETFARLGIPVPTASLVGQAPPVLFVDTADDPAARDSVAGFAAEEARDNGREAQIVAYLLAGLFDGVGARERAALAEEIGVISPYRRQNNRIRQALASIDPFLGQSIRVDTVDRFQGGERDVIVVSLTNSNGAGVIGALHADWRRMNVAISRARRSLVIVGDRRTFTRRGRQEVEPAKEVYRRLFAELDRLVAAGEAEVISSAGLAR